MEKFSNLNYKKNKKLFDLVTEFHELSNEIVEVFNKKNFRIRALEHHKKAFLYLFNTALKSFSAIHLLCKEGYGQDSSIVLRSVLENLISAKYMLIGDRKSIENKASRFEEYKWIELKRYTEYWKLEDIGQDEKLKNSILLKEPEVIQKVKEFKKKFTAKDLTIWSGVSLRTMAEAVNMLPDYLLTYKLCCSLSHSSFIGSMQRTRNAEKGINFSSNPSFGGIIEDMKSSMAYLENFLVIFNDIFSLGTKEKIDIWHNKALAIFEMPKYKIGLELNGL